MTALEQLGAYVSHGVRGCISEPLRAALALHLGDTLTAWVATAGTAEARTLRTFQRDTLRNVADPTLNVMINCALTRLSETDDIHLASMITPGAIVVPGALTIAATLPPNPAALQEAIIAGYEAMIRLGLALDGPTILYRGIWPSLIAAPVGIAAAAVRLLDLSASQAAHALAIALTLAAPGVGQHHAPTGSRWLAIGVAARNGVLAAHAARAGFTSDLAILEGSFFNTVYGIKPKVPALAEDLGVCAKLTEVSFKPWCAARQTMAATQALHELLRSGLVPGDVTAIDVSVPPPFLKMIDHGIGGGRIARLTSQQFQLAIAALIPDLAFDIAQATDVPPDVLRFMDGITVRVDENLLDGFPLRWSARIRVRTRQTEYERLIAHIPGDPDRPTNKLDLISKARRLIGRVAEDIVDQCEGLLEGRISPAQLIAFIEQSCANP